MEKLVLENRSNLSSVISVNTFALQLKGSHH